MELLSSYSGDITDSDEEISHTDKESIGPSLESDRSATQNSENDNQSQSNELHQNLMFDSAARNGSNDGHHQESFMGNAEESLNTNFFGLAYSDDDESHEVTLTDDKKCSKESNGERVPVSTKPALPQTNFWSGRERIEDWTKPETIWKSHQPCAAGDSHRSNNHLITKKRKRVNPRHERSSTAMPSDGGKSMSTTIDESSTHSKLLKKTCFYVHHKVKPFLHQNLRSIPPKSKYHDLAGHAGCVNRLQWGRAEYSHLLLSVSMDRTVKIWDVFGQHQGCIQQFVSHTKAIKDCRWTQSGKEILTCSYDRTARLYDVERGTEIQVFDHPNHVTCLDIHPVNSNYFITGSLNSLYCWDKRTGEKHMKKYGFKESFGQVQDVSFLKNGSTFMTCTDLVTRDSANRNIMAWDFAKAVVVSNQIYQELFVCQRIKQHPIESCFFAQSQGGYIAQFSSIPPYKMHKGKKYDGHKVLSYNVGFDLSPDGSILASGSADGHLYIYDYHLGCLKNRLPMNMEICLDVAWHPVLASVLAVSSWEGHIAICR